MEVSERTKDHVRAQCVERTLRKRKGLSHLKPYSRDGREVPLSPIQTSSSRAMPRRRFGHPLAEHGIVKIERATGFHVKRSTGYSGVPPLLPRPVRQGRVNKFVWLSTRRILPRDLNATPQVLRITVTHFSDFVTSRIGTLEMKENKNQIGQLYRGILAFAATVLLCFACIIDSTYASVVRLSSLWKLSEPLTVCFIDGGNAEQDLIVNLLLEWTQGTGLELIFHRAPEYPHCDKTAGKVRIQVGISDSLDPSWSFVGTDALKVTGATAAIVPSLDRTNRTLALRAVGHIFGFLHDEQDPALHCESVVRKDVSTQFGGIKNELKLPANSQLVDDLSRPSISNNGSYLITPIERTSVMHLFFDPNYILDAASPCLGEPTGTLSEGNHKTMRILYPPRPIPIDTISSTQSMQMAVRFEGVLAVEQYGYVLNALYNADAISLRKIFAQGGTVSEVLSKAGVTPFGQVTAGVDTFMCKINAHICSNDNNIKWRLAPLATNPLEDDRPCPNRELPASVLCLPNVHLESYDQVLSVSVPQLGKKTTGVITDVLRGCEVVNDECLQTIKTINFPDKQHLSPEELNDFRGVLELPAKAYRLVLTYADDAQRVAIATAIDRVVKERSEVLRTPSDDIGIFVTYAVGKGTRQQVHTSLVLSEPDSSYVSALLAMHYPFLTLEQEKDLNEYRGVDVAIWDTHVDDNHCKLQNQQGEKFTFPTWDAAAPLANPPRPRSTNCAVSWTTSQIDRFDHATAVAGIISAAINQHGIAGVNPGTRVWAWEVLSGAPFNAGGDPRLLMAKQYAMLSPKVVNVSETFDVSPGLSSLQTLLLGKSQRPGLANAMLFVASAGVSQNKGDISGARIDDYGSCQWYPACWNQSSNTTTGIISVVALDTTGSHILRDNQGIALTDFGPVFDVAAPGILTAPIYGDYVATVAGSSFAAPFVTGLATLILGKANKLNTPLKTSELKERILITADYIPDVSRFGRVNFDNALNFDRDVLTMQPSPTCPTGCSVDGRIIRPTQAQLHIISGVEDDGTTVGANVYIDVESIRRIQLDSAAATFRIIYVKGQNLHVITDAQFESTAKNTTNRFVLTVNGTKLPLDPNTIADYIPCSFLPSCH